MTRCAKKEWWTVLHQAIEADQSEWRAASLRSDLNGNIYHAGANSTTHASLFFLSTQHQ